MKVLITADVHINDYPNYNFSTGSRLEQFNKLTERFIELGKSFNCEEIWILGDLIDLPTSRGYILHTARHMIKSLCSEFSAVRYILGNHDSDSKSQILNEVTSQVTLFDYPNYIYMDRKILDWDGHKLGFCNWRPEQDLSWIEDHVDVLFGHYTKSELFGQDIDESKFDLMIHGDIHNSQVIDKFVSVCNPIQHDFSSENEGKVLLFDTVTLNWERIKVDPDHTRFLQLHYTEDKSEEGFHGPLEYKVYKPQISLESESETTRSITWTDIDTLLTEHCKSLDILDIHNEVISKCVPYSEIDFNFLLKRLHIHGYRSILDMTIDFNKNDRIVLLGDNGSGKSSIIRSLRGVFDKNSNLKYEQSKFCDNQLIELSLVYQNKLYEITKGNICRLVIDGTEQQYASKRGFEDDLKVKLPFLNYLDLMFITPSALNLASQFTSQRRIELISKFYRLDRIQAYWKTAQNLYSEVNIKLTELQNTRNVQIGILNHITARLTELDQYKDIDASEVLSEIEKFTKLRSDYDKYNQWIETKSKLEWKIEVSNNRINSLKSDIKSIDDMMAIEPLDVRIKILETSLKESNDNYNLIYKRSIDWESASEQLAEVKDKGVEKSKEFDKLQQGTCPMCGTKLNSAEHNKLIVEVGQELETLRNRYTELDEQISKLNPDGYTKESFIRALRELKSKHDEIAKQLDNLRSKKSDYDLYKGQLIAEESNRKELQSELDKLLEESPEKITLPQNLSQLELDLNSKYAKINEYKNEIANKKIQESKISELDDQVKEVSDELEKYDKYISLTSMEGKVYEEILTALAQKFSTTDFKYEVEAGVYRGSNYIEFNSLYLVKDEYRYYDSLSDGQRTLCDIDFLNKLFSVQVGLLVLDETFSHLDDKNTPRIYEIIKNMNVNTLILATHDSNVSMHTRRFLLKLNSSGITEAIMD